MSWAKKTGKAPGGGDELKINEEENDFPFASVTSVRIGSAHAVERGDRDTLSQLLTKYLNDVNAAYDPNMAANAVVFEEK